MNLGENIYNCRTKRNLSQGDLAEALDVSRQSVSKWENNSAVPELDKLMKMAAVFEISLDELVSGEERERPVPVPEEKTMQEPAYKLMGAVLMGLGLLGLLLLMIAGAIFREDLYFWAFVWGIPLVAAGSILLLPGRNTGYWACTVLYLVLSGLLMVTMPGGFGARTVFVAVLLILAGMGLGTWTVVKLRREQMNPGAAALVLVLLLVIVGLLIAGTAIGLMPPRELVGEDAVIPSEIVVKP